MLESVRARKKPSDWDDESLAAFAPEFSPDMARLLSASEGMKSRELPGGTGPNAVATALTNAKARLRAMRETFQAK